MEDQSQVLWSDLPRELWRLIGQCLDTYIDVLRFRSVCRLWRCSLSHPLNSNPHIYSLFYEYVIFRSIIYRFTPLDHHQSSNSVSSEGFLAMIDGTNLLSPKSNNEGKKVNFLDFRIQEVARSYSLRSNITQTTNFERELRVLVSKVKKHKNTSIIVALYYKGMLWFMEYEESFRGKGNPIVEPNSIYDDMIVYKGQIYTIDRQGRVFLIDSSMKLLQISPPMSFCGDFKHLVECGVELYVVDRFVERKEILSSPNFDSFWFGCRRWCNDVKSVDFKVHRLDQGMKRWVEVNNLGNNAFVLGMKYCFSISAPHNLQGFKRNCIYFLHQGAHEFDFDKSIIMKSNAQILRADPSWTRRSD